MKQARFSRPALKALARISRPGALKIRAKIDQLATDPASLANNIKALKGVDTKRLRVGNYRVIFRDDLTILDIIAIGHRREVYEQETAMKHEPQFITAPDGSRLVILAEAVYLALIEADEDARDTAAAVAGLESIGRDGAIPSDVAYAMLDGANPVAAWRAYRGLSQAQLADAAGLTQAAVARIEKAAPGAGRASTRKAIAAALDAPLWSLDARH